MASTFAVLVVGSFLFGGASSAEAMSAPRRSALWFDFSGVLPLLSSVLIAGGVLALLILTARMFTGNSTSNRNCRAHKNAGIPYGIAIARRNVIVMLSCGPDARSPFFAAATESRQFNHG